MRKLLVLLAVFLPAIAVTVANADPASAFGSERLGCYITPSRTVPPQLKSGCQDTMPASSYTADFQVMNQSGTYGFTWSVPSLYTSNISRGCTSGTTICVLSNLTPTSEITVSVTITQSGHSATLSTTAYIEPWCDGVPCG